MHRPDEPDLCIVIPAYNEENRIRETLERLAEEFRGWHKLQFLVCDDGSSDQTTAVAEAAARRLSLRLTVLKQQHSGKGQAMRYALQECSSHYVAISDADITLRSGEVEQALRKLSSADLVIFSKTKQEGGKNLPRWVMSRGFSLLLRLLFQIPFHDTQGVKVMRLSAVRQIMPACQSTGFFLEAEIVIVARRVGLRVVEQPWLYSYSGGSKVTASAILKMVVDALRTKLSGQPSLGHSLIDRNLNTGE